LAQKVLANKTKGYRHHPQLDRFKSHADPLRAIGFYLYCIYKEGKRRGYRFDVKKISRNSKNCAPIKVFCGQVDFEAMHLASKLSKRDKEAFRAMKKQKKLKLHPLFKPVKGGREAWEKHG